MPKLVDMFPTRFISAGDVAKLKKSDTTFVIEKVLREEGMNPRTKKSTELWVVYFHGCKKGLKIRKSQIPLLSASLGASTEEWTDKEVTLYAESTQVGAGARIKPKNAAARASAPVQAAPVSDDLAIDEAMIPEGQ